MPVLFIPGGCVGSCWLHVRHVPQGDKWHTATDQMRGTEEYGEQGGDMAWSIMFTNISYDQVARIN